MRREVKHIWLICIWIMLSVMGIKYGFAADKIPPVVTITQPVANTMVSGSVAISGTAVDDNLKGWVLEAYVKGWKVIGSGTTARGATSSIASGVWNAKGLPGGTYTLRLTGEDMSGNKKYVEVKVIVPPPVITRIEIIPAVATVTTNNRAGFKVQGYDASNNRVEYQAGIMPPINWGVITGSGTLIGTVGANTSFMAGKSPGSVTIKASIGT
ncbi:MAG: Ig-like domain-containing protein, partial [Candidatus Desantisbacteria bacterium]